MYLIYKENSKGRKEYFTGKITCTKGERVPVMTRSCDMKKYSDIKSVFKAKRTLEAKCKSAMPFEIGTTKGYLKERGLI